MEFSRFRRDGKTKEKLQEALSPEWLKWCIDQAASPKFGTPAAVAFYSHNAEMHARMHTQIQREREIHSISNTHTHAHLQIHIITHLKEIKPSLSSEATKGLIFHSVFRRLNRDTVPLQYSEMFFFHRPPRHHSGCLTCYTVTHCATLHLTTSIFFFPLFRFKGITGIRFSKHQRCYIKTQPKELPNIPELEAEDAEIEVALHCLITGLGVTYI